LGILSGWNWLITVSSGRLNLDGVEAPGYKFTVLGSKSLSVFVFTCTQLSHFNSGPKLAGTKLGFWILKATAGIRNTKKPLIWLALSIRLANPILTFLPSGSPLSAMTSTSHREDLYDVADGYGFISQMALTVGTVFTSSLSFHALVFMGLSR
jgi:hypothetical protein